MKEKGNSTNLPLRQSRDDENKDLEGYPSYPASEDIYSKYQKEKSINPEDTSKTKESIENDKVGTSNEKDLKDSISGNDLDVPGSELDDQQENIGSEDEQNNYYSLGDDDPNDLEENKEE